MYTIKISWECYSSFCESSGITNHTTNNFVFHIVGNYRKVVTLFILEVASAIAVKLYVHTQKSMEVINTEAGLENSESINSDHVPVQPMQPCPQGISIHHRCVILSVFDRERGRDSWS